MIGSTRRYPWLQFPSCNSLSVLIKMAGSIFPIEAKVINRKFVSQ